MSKPDEDDTELVQRLFTSLSDTASDSDRKWSLFGLQVTSPAGYQLDEYDLKSGHIRLQFSSGKSILQADRLSLADALLREASLEEWYGGFFAKDLRYLNYTAEETLGLGDQSILVRGVPKSRAQSLLQPLPFWDARPRRFFTARAWLDKSENRIIVIQSFWKTEDEAPDIDTVSQSVSPTRPTVSVSGNLRA
jgi:hypothetical protein